MKHCVNRILIATIFIFFIATSAFCVENYIILPSISDIFVWHARKIRVQVSDINSFSKKDIQELHEALERMINKEAKNKIDLSIEIKKHSPQRIVFYCNDKKRTMPLAVLDCQIMKSNQYYIRSATLYTVGLR